MIFSTFAQDGDAALGKIRGLKSQISEANRNIAEINRQIAAGGTEEQMKMLYKTRDVLKNYVKRLNEELDKTVGPRVSNNL